MLRDHRQELENSIGRMSSISGEGGGAYNDLASQGRYGDTTLMHVNPAEVEGLAAAFPGRITQNPTTGLPEAWAWFVPLLMGAAVGGLSGALRGGDEPLWKRVLKGAAIGGVTSGVTMGAGAALSAAAPAATAATGAATVGTEQLAASAIEQGVAQTATDAAAANLASETAKQTGIGRAADIAADQSRLIADQASLAAGDALPQVTPSYSDALKNPLVNPDPRTSIPGGRTASETVRLGNVVQPPDAVFNPRSGIASLEGVPSDYVPDVSGAESALSQKEAAQSALDLDISERTPWTKGELLDYQQGEYDKTGGSRWSLDSPENKSAMDLYWGQGKFIHPIAAAGAVQMALPKKGGFDFAKWSAGQDPAYWEEEGWAPGANRGGLLRRGYAGGGLAGALPRGYQQGGMVYDGRAFYPVESPQGQQILRQQGGAGAASRSIMGVSLPPPASSTKAYWGKGDSEVAQSPATPVVGMSRYRGATRPVSTGTRAASQATLSSGLAGLAGLGRGVGGIAPLQSAVPSSSAARRAASK